MASPIQKIINALKDGNKIKGFTVFLEGENNSPFDAFAERHFAMDSVKDNYVYLYSRNRLAGERQQGNRSDPYLFEVRTPYSLLIVLTNEKLFNFAKINEIIQAFAVVLLDASADSVRGFTADTNNIDVIQNEVKRIKKTIEDDLNKFSSVRTMRIDFEIKETLSLDNCSVYDFCSC